MQFVFTAFNVLLAYSLTVSNYTNKLRLSLLCLIMLRVIIMRPRLSRFAMIYILLLAIAALAGLMPIFTDSSYQSVGYIQNLWMYNRCVYWLVTFAFSVGVVIYFDKLDRNEIFRILWFSLYLNMFGLLLDFASKIYSGNIDRISGFSFEPGHAAIYYAFILPFVFAPQFYYQINKMLSYAFVAMAILIRSKILPPILIIYILIRLSLKNSLLLIVFIASLLFGSIYHMIDCAPDKDCNSYLYKTSIGQQIFWIKNDIQKIYHGGLHRFIYNNEQGKPSYVVRLSSIHMALLGFADHPFGSGWGAFNVNFISMLNNNNLVLITQSGMDATGYFYNEAQDLYNNVQEATPKSSIIEIIYSTGIFGLVLIIWTLTTIYRLVGFSNPIFISSILLIIACSLTESTLFLPLFSLLLVLAIKDNRELS